MRVRRRLRERGEHLGHNLDVGGERRLAVVREGADVLFEELLLAVVVAVAVGRGEEGGQVTYLGKHSLLAHNSKFIYIYNQRTPFLLSEGPSR